MNFWRQIWRFWCKRSPPITCTPVPVRQPWHGCGTRDVVMDPVGRPFHNYSHNRLTVDDRILCTLTVCSMWSWYVIITCRSGLRNKFEDVGNDLVSQSFEGSLVHNLGQDGWYHVFRTTVAYWDRVVVDVVSQKVISNVHVCMSFDSVLTSWIVINLRTRRPDCLALCTSVIAHLFPLIVKSSISTVALLSHA